MNRMARTTLIAGGIALAAQVALAQNTSALMPEAPKPGPGQALPAYPGQPLPQPAPVSTPGTVTRKRQPGDSTPEAPEKPPAPTGRYVYDEGPLGSDEN